MARDYAKNRNSQGQSRYRSSKRPAQNNGWLFLLMGLFLGLLIAGLTYLKLKPTTTPASTPTAVTTAKKPTPVANNTAPAPQTAPPEVNNKPQFDFYTMLPDMNVPSDADTPPRTPPAAKIVPPAPVIAKPTLPSPASPSYILQIAALTQASDAESLKAELAMLGFQATVTPIKNGTKMWYRVALGPYTSLTTAQNIQAQLQGNNTKSIIVTKKTA